MKDELIKTIEEVVELLHLCGMGYHARPLVEISDVLSREPVESKVFQEELRRLGNMLGGMGSLTDLSLVPEDEKAMSREDARKKQWELADALCELITELEH
jgi:hypothetical protein